MNKKILIIRLGAIGDVVETTGLVRALKKAGATVDYLTSKMPAQVLENDTDINKLIIFEKKQYSYIFSLAQKFKKEKYDIIINLQPSIRLKILAFLSGAKQTVNYKKSYKYHAVENFFETGKRILPEIELDKNIKLCINNDLKEKMQLQLSNKTKICFNTGANSSRQGRKWCVEHWSQLAKLILEKYDVEIFAVGAKEDENNVNQLVQQVPEIKSFAGKTTLQETIALLSCADIVVSGDTGPLHIASAVTPICIGLYGCCSVSRSGPYGTKHLTISSDLNCAPCDKRTCKFLNSDIDDTPCMRAIKPTKVINLIDTIMSQK